MIRSLPEEDRYTQSREEHLYKQREIIAHKGSPLKGSRHFGGKVRGLGARNRRSEKSIGRLGADRLDRFLVEQRAKYVEHDRRTSGISRLLIAYTPTPNLHGMIEIMLAGLGNQLFT